MPNKFLEIQILFYRDKNTITSVERVLSESKFVFALLIIADNGDTVVLHLHAQAVVDGDDLV